MVLPLASALLTNDLINDDDDDDNNNNNNNNYTFLLFDFILALSNIIRVSLLILCSCLKISSLKIKN